MCLAYSEHSYISRYKRVYTLMQPHILSFYILSNFDFLSVSRNQEASRKSVTGEEKTSKTLDYMYKKNGLKLRGICIDFGIIDEY